MIKNVKQYRGNESAAQPAGVGMRMETRLRATMATEMQLLRIESPKEDSTTTATPSFRSHVMLETPGSFRAKRQPGCE